VRLINPAFTESYELLAFLSLVNNEELDEAVLYMKKALQMQPGNQRYAIRIAEINSRQGKFAEAAEVAQKIAQTASEPEIKSQAERLLSTLREREELIKQHGPVNSRTAVGGPPILQRHTNEEPLSAEEIEKVSRDLNNLSINEALRKPVTGEIRVIAHIESINCSGQPIIYSLKTDAEMFKVTSVDFQGLSLNMFDSQELAAEVGCDAKIASAQAVVTYRPKADPKKISRGEMVAVEFVPKTFRLLNEKEIQSETARLNSSSEVTITESVSTGDSDDRRRRAMMDAIKVSMRKPAAGEKQLLGFIEKADCGSKHTFFHFKTKIQPLKMSVGSPNAIQMRAFINVENLQIGCGMKNVDVPVVVTYKEMPNAKTKSNGELVSLEFVPATFVLEN